jgi:hypothetical protein
MQGDSALLQDLLDGNWSAQRFLALEPGQAIRADYGSGIVEAARA